MKRVLLVCVAISVVTSMFAGLSGSSETPHTQGLINDRFRNTIAVDPEVQGEGIRFYAATFGLEAYRQGAVPSESEINDSIYDNAPVPIDGSLVRFGIKNSTATDWIFNSDIIIDNMGAPPFSDNGGVNCYTQAEEGLLTNPSISYPAGWMRYRSGTGFWASPVLVEGTQNILLLNKSGCLMYVDLSSRAPVIIWKRDLRESERSSDTSTYQYEFMATPTVIGNQIYVPGIKKIHVINLQNGANTSQACIPSTTNDYFTSELVQDLTNPDSPGIRVLAISHFGKVFEMENMTVAELTTGSGLGVSLSPPWVDTDGNIYFVTRESGNGIKLSYLEQNIRSSADITTISSHVIYHENGEMVSGATLTDFTQNSYLLTDTAVVKIDKSYTHSSFSITSNPTNLPLSDIEYGQFLAPFGNTKTRYHSNSGILLYKNETKRTLFATIINWLSVGFEHVEYFDNYVQNYYPDTPAECNLHNSLIVTPYGTFNNAFEDGSFSTQEQAKTVPNDSSWGAISPYVSSIPGDYCNYLFGDERGCITTYDACIDSQSLNFDPVIDVPSNDMIIPEMGYTKHMDNQNNIPYHNTVVSKDFYIVDLVGNSANTIGESCFVNAYFRDLTTCLIPSTNITAKKLTIEGLLPNKKYTLAWQHFGTLNTISGITIDGATSSTPTMISAEADLVIAANDQNATIDGQGFPYSLNSITLNANSTLTVLSDINVYQITMQAGSRLVIAAGANVSAEMIDCISNDPENEISISCSGVSNSSLSVTGNVTVTNQAQLIIEGFGSESYDFNLVYVKDYAEIHFTKILEVDYVSANVNKIQIVNQGGLYIDDAISVNELKTESNTNTLITKVSSLNFNRCLMITGPGDSRISGNLEIGSNENRTAIMTIDIPATNYVSFASLASFSQAHVYGSLNLRGQSRVRIDQQYWLHLLPGSSLNLNGGSDITYSGAELLICGILGLNGSLKLYPGCHISGFKADPDENDESLHGDRIITNEYGNIIGNSNMYEEGRYLDNINITSSNPSGERWEGITINTIFVHSQAESQFKIINSQISGIAKIFVKYPCDPQYIGNHYYNCTYGVYLSQANDIEIQQNALVESCVFTSNYCGILVWPEPISMTAGNQYLSISVKNNHFGGSADLEKNNFGICLINCKVAGIEGSLFMNNTYGIYAQDSGILVGGIFGINDVPTNTDAFNNQIAPNNFYFNDKAAIWLYRPTAKSLIYNNTFSITEAAHGRKSGIGIYASDAELNVMNNDFAHLLGHGFFGKQTHRTIPALERYHGFSGNSFLDNGGCELIGDAVSLGSLEIMASDPQDTDPNTIIKTTAGIYPSVPSSLEDYSQWNHYLVANITPGEIATVAGTWFSPTWGDDPTRFYPEVEAFDFDGDDPIPPGSLKDMIINGVSSFYQGDFVMATSYMKQAIETYPDSMATALAVDYLYLIERLDSGDFQALREYLDLNISSEAFAPYLKKEEIKTECYVKEADFLSAIQRLQLILENPLSAADSLFALIDQAYCVFQAASGGEKNLPDNSVETTDIRSYLDFLSSLEAPVYSNQSVSTPGTGVVIHANYPNPFNPHTTISYGLPTSGRVSVSVYNLRGQLVRKLLDDHQDAGNHKIIWNGKDSHDKGVASGIYFVKIDQNKRSRVHRMMMIK